MNRHEAELEISQWVEWFRGINNPEVQRKVAERQLSMLKAEKRMLRWEAIYGRRRGLFVETANDLETEQLEEHFAKTFPKVPRGPMDHEDRDRFREEREAALQSLIDAIGLALRGGK